MKLLVLHLSDIHIRTPDDPILQRSGSIVSAVQNLLNPPDLILLIVSGDVAYSGQQDEYMLAWEFLDDICKALAAAASPIHGIHKVVVPGNHDCDFSAPSQLRPVMLSALQKKPELAFDKLVIEACIEPQRAFFEFQSAFAEGLITTAQVHPSLYGIHTIRVGGETVRIHACNTAWMSLIPDPQGGLLYPPLNPFSIQETANLDIVVFHHPYNWLEANNARLFRGHVDAIADIVLTGHEHVPSQADVVRDRGNEITIFEGGVLQETGDPSVSAFNAVLLDTVKCRRRAVIFSWQGERYVSFRDEQPLDQELLWEDYRNNPTRARSQFTLTKEFAVILNDLDINVTHRVKGQLTLRDIFVFPDLREITFQNQESKISVKGDDVVSLVSEHSCLLITGDDFSGKSALAKMIFWTLHQQGEIPLLLDATRCTVADDRVEALLERVFCEQYDASALEAFRQAPKARRVVIVDNLHRVPLAPELRAALLRKLRGIFFRVVAFAHELEAAVLDLSAPASSLNMAVAFRCYELLPFGQLRRNRLVERWLLLSGSEGASTTEFAHTLDRLTDLLNSVIGKNFLPPYPVYVLAALQAAEAGTNLNVDASTHAYLYEVFIKTSLARRSSPVKVNVVTAFLTHFAHALHRSASDEMREEELRVFFDWFGEEYETTRAYEQFIEDLIAQHILVRSNDHVSFRHAYLFFYFTACYLRDHIHESESRGDIRVLISSLANERAANVLLFLTHLSKDPFIVEELLLAAASQFPGIKEATLQDDVVFLNKLHASAATLEIPDVSPRQTREEYLAALDEEELNGRHLSSHDASANDLLVQINGGLKMIQVLGQILKNFPANLNREKKSQILASCSSLGRRLLTAYLGLVSENERALLEVFVETIKRNEPSMTTFAVRERAVATIVGISEMTAYGLIKRLSHAIGLRDLMAVYERVYGVDDGPFSKLLLASLSLDHAGEFPEKLVEDTMASVHKNAFAHSVLRYLVFMRLMLFPAKFQTRQKMAQILKFSYQKTVAQSAQRTLIK